MEENHYPAVIIALVADYIYIYSVTVTVIKKGDGDLNSNLAQPVGALECTGCISAEGQEPPNMCPGYNTKLIVRLK